MNSWRIGQRLVPAVLLTVSAIASADFFEPHHGGGTTRTYFGRPGTGPYGNPGMGGGGHHMGANANPYTCKLFGLRFCQTAETRQADYERRMARAEARAQTIIARAQHQCPTCSNLAPCGGCGCPPGPGCGNCWLFGMCNNPGNCTAGKGCGGHFGPGGPGGALPGMNREDAVRYLEGNQYYPPYHTLRSPRDFYMFDEKYGLGR
jgi:hypothetical protein